MIKIIIFLLFTISFFSYAQVKENDSINKIVETQIQEVEILAKKKLIERKVDRLVFNVENSISATGGDALDALKVTPGLKVQNDQISMIGKGNMLVLINDRPTQLTGDDLISYLKTLKSDEIKKIREKELPFLLIQYLQPREKPELKTKRNDWHCFVKTVKFRIVLL